MTRLKLYRCDRCGDNFEVREGEEPFTLKCITEGEKSILHLCDDCEASFWIFIDRVDEFDELADKLARGEGGS